MYLFPGMDLSITDPDEVTAHHTEIMDRWEKDDTFVYAMDGSYTVCLVTSNNCHSDTTCQTVNVCALPVAGFSFTANMLAYNFTDTTSNTPTSWAWDMGDGTTYGNQNPQHTYAQPGMYTVCLIATSSCGADTTCTTVNASTIGLEGDLAGYLLEVWPNPAENSTQLRLQVPAATTLSIRLRDVTGRSLMQLEPGVSLRRIGKYPSPSVESLSQFQPVIVIGACSTHPNDATNLA